MSDYERAYMNRALCQLDVNLVVLAPPAEDLTTRLGRLAPLWSAFEAGYVTTLYVILQASVHNFYIIIRPFTHLI